MQPLFLEAHVDFPKTAAMTQLPEDPNAWPHEILQELYKQAPYVADFSPHVVMEKVDGEQGYGLGHVEVGNQTEIQGAATPDQMSAAGVRKVRVPVVIKDGMLSPFDLLVSDDSKVLPLTEVRLRSAIFRPQAFDVTSRTPGDQSMIGQLYPPYRQNQGFGGGGSAMNIGMGKEGSALENYLTEKTASFQSETNPFMEADYLHAPTGTKQGRYGKKMASGEMGPGAFEDFILKNKTASAVRNVAKALAGAAPKQSTTNLAAAKHHATAAATRSSALVKGLKKTGSVLQAILPTIRNHDLLEFKRAIVDPELQPLLYKNASTMTPVIELLLAPRPKTASVEDLVVPSVVQLRRADEGYRVKSASHAFWQPKTELISRGEAVARFGEKTVLAADLSGAATISDGESGVEHIEAEEAPPEAAGAAITEAGFYKVRSAEGEETEGYVIPNLVDTDGTVLPLSLFTNGTHATVQGDIVGSPSESGGGLPLEGGGTPSGYGVFVAMDADGVKATVPLTIAGSADMGDGEPTVYKGESFTGEDVMVSVQPNIQTVVGTEEGTMLVPDSWQWMPLEQTEGIALESQEDGLQPKEAAAHLGDCIWLVGAGGETFSFRGEPVEKLAHDEREALGLDDSMFLLAGFGVEPNYSVKKLAQAMTGEAPVQVRVGRHIKLASEQRHWAIEQARAALVEMPELRQRLFKEAAALGDPQAVDTVLSLGFLNPENLTTFISYLPLLEDAQTKLCDLLLASRLGSLLDTPEGAIERSVRSTEAVLEGLKALAFQQN